MEPDKNELKHRNTTNQMTDDKKTPTTESENETGQSKPTNDSKAENVTASTTSSSNVPTVIRTKEDYFDALRVWLQQVQLQQMAYTYFPYYLSANLPPNMNTVFNTSMPFPTPPPPAAAAAAAGQFPAFPPAQMGGIGQFNFANGGNAGGDALNRGGPFIGNSIFQNRNQYMENMRQNMQILYQNGGYEYVIAPIWKRVMAEAIDVRPNKNISNHSNPICKLMPSSIDSRFRLLFCL